MINQKSKANFALFALAVIFFAVGVTEFISVGVLPAISKSFMITTSTAGLITTIYALGVALGAPILTILTAKFQRKGTILGAIIIFIIGHLIIGFATNFGEVIFGRLIAGASHGLLFALSSTIAAELVDESRQASAIAYIFTGFTIATALGAPLGTAVSTYWGWWIPFLAIATLGIVAWILNRVALPKQARKNVEISSIADQVKLILHLHVLLTLLITILGYGGTFATFTYLSSILQKITHVPANQVSFFLVIYGVAIAIGNTLGGKLGNAKPINALFGIFIVQGLALFAFYFTVTNIYLSTLNIVLLGLVAFMSVPVLQSYILILAKSYSSKAVDVASSLNISAFSFGIVGGSFLGGVALDTYGLRSTMLLAAAMVALAVLMMLVENKFENKRQK